MIRLEERFNKIYDNILNEDTSNNTVLNKQQQRALAAKYDVCPTCGRPIPQYFSKQEPHSKDDKYGKYEELGEISSAVDIKDRYDSYDEIILDFIIPVLTKLDKVSFATDIQTYGIKRLFGINCEAKTVDEIALETHKSPTTVLENIRAGIRNFVKFLVYYGIECYIPRQVQWSDMTRAKNKLQGIEK